MTGPEPEPLAARPLPERGEVYLPECDLIIRTAPAETPETGLNCFTVSPVGTMTIRGKMSGDAITLPGGTKSLKKLFIDRKIPRIQRPLVPVITDEQGILAVAGIGPDEKRRTGETLIRIEIVKTSQQAVEI